FRLAGDNQKALLLYNNIIKLYPGTPYAKDSRERIEKLAQATTAPPATTPAPVTPIAPPAPVVVPPPPAIEPAAPPPGASVTIVATAPPTSGEAHPVYTRWWFWTIVGVVA